MTYIPWIVIGAVLVVIGIGTWVSGSGNPNYRMHFGSEKPWRSS
jgi:hypothetical protein